MTNNIAIVGAGGLGRETACCLRALNENGAAWNLVGFFDDGLPAGTANEYGRVLGTVDDLNNWKEPLSVVLAIASPTVLQRISGLLDNPLLDFPNIIAPDARFFDRDGVTMGRGNVVGFGHTFSCHVTMGDFNLFSCGSLIGHDVAMGSWNAVTNGCKISGAVTMGDANFLGAASVVLPGKTLGSRVTLGANSTLTRDALEPGTYAGCPAVLKKALSAAPDAQKKPTIWLSLAQTGEEEERFVREAFTSQWVTTVGPNVDAFERELEEYLGEGHVIALASGTSALHLGLLMLGVGPGDEVLCQSMTFAASANPIVYQGASPVFVDSEENTWNMSPEKLEEAIQDRIRQTGRTPRAIIPVDLYGMPADMDAILDLATRYGIPVLEDAAEALGSEYRGKKCGTFGAFGAFSFNGNKIITTSGGGALLCPDEESRDKVKFYATQARDQAPHYQHSHIGYNYRLSNVCAGIGRGQMRSLPAFLAKRRAIHAEYRERLAHIPGLTLLENPGAGYDSNFWLTCVLVDPEEAGFDREELRLALQKAAVETRPLWKPMHLQPVFRACPYYGTGVSDRLFDRGLCLPSGVALQSDDMNRILDVVNSLSH